LEGSKSGFTLKFWKKSIWDDMEYRTAFIHLSFFHFFFLIALLSLFRTIFNNPGHLKQEYVELYSIINFLKIFFDYILNYKEPNYKLNFHMKNTNLGDDMILLLNSKKLIKKTIAEYKEAYM